MDLAPTPANWIDEPIQECGESLECAPSDYVSGDIHPYVAKGAVYPKYASPYMMRAGVLERLMLAQNHLSQERPGCHILIFDAYRPLSVQQQMVDLRAIELAPQFGYDPNNLTNAQRDEIAAWDPFWAKPTFDVTRPPSHSTGGSLDVYIVDEHGAPIPISPDNHADVFDTTSDVDHYKDATDPGERAFHENRMLLQRVMEKAGFIHNPREPWHFDYGNQRWAHFMRVLKGVECQAIYGRVDFIGRQLAFAPRAPQ